MLRHLYDERMAADGASCWATARVLPLEAWATARWQALAAGDSSRPLLLTESQAAWPWRRLASDFLADTLVSVPELASAARRSWLRLRRYGGSLAQLGGLPLTRDQQQFLGWAMAVEAALGDAGWLDPGSIVEALTGRAGELEDRESLLVAGNDPLTPQLRCLIDALARHGWECELADPRVPGARTWLHGAADPGSELQSMLAWARQRLAAEPGVRLACIVPDLQARRSAVERGLEAWLQPELELPGSTASDRVFDLAGGQSLEAFGVAATALDCLATGDEPIDSGCLSRLLRSPHVRPADDTDARARLDVELRRTGIAQWSRGALEHRLQGAGSLTLSQALRTAQRALGGPVTLRPADEWARRFGEVLAAWGWPGPGPLASDEYQAAGALRERLAELAGVARTAPPMVVAQALADFRRLVAGPYQPQRGRPSLWLLDALEPVGLAFDGLWVAGLTAAAWPGPASHDPFIPLPLQVTLGMPGADADSALALSQATLDAWRSSAAEVVLSWPQRQDDAQVEPSPLLPQEAGAATPAAVAVVRARSLFRSTALVPVGATADAPPPFSGPSKGGARVLELQAKCPFRAFAELRLGARPLDEPQAGVDARSRGILLHRAMETIWNELGGQPALLALDDDAREALLEHAVEEALARLPGESPGPRAVALERQWQRQALGAMLELDHRREPFEVVASERSLEVDLEGLQLQLRVDRIDRVREGLVVIDYKTGRATTGQWRGARPEAPQLMLYATRQQEAVAGVAFALAGAQQARYCGLAAEADLLPGTEAAAGFRPTDTGEPGTSWEDLLARWDGWLQALAKAYCRGDAQVDPKQPRTCRYCHLETFCRVGPVGNDADGEATVD